MLRAYNAEAENCVKTVKAGNLHAAQARLAKAVAQIEKHGKMIDLRVTPSYHEFRLLELQIAADFQLKLQEEKEAEHERLEELREQRRAEQELEAERQSTRAVLCRRCCDGGGAVAPVVRVQTSQQDQSPARVLLPVTRGSVAGSEIDRGRGGRVHHYPDG